MIIENKKGVELTLQTIILLIIGIIVLIVIVYFFITHYGDIFGKITGSGDTALEAAKKDLG